MTARVLVVDDDEATRHMLGQWLTAEHHEVLLAANLAQGLEMASSAEPQVVITDLNMAGGSGIDLCRRLGDAWPDTPVIVITAFGSMTVAIEAMRAGAFDFITKP